MILEPMDVVVIKGNWWNPMAYVIYQRTSTFWSHCVMVKDSKGNLFDPTMGGIKSTNLDHYKKRQMIVRRYKYDFDREKLLKWCYEKQCQAEDYDYLALLGFLTGIKAFENDNNWYCSELPYFCYLRNGYPLTDADLTFVYPCFFLQSKDFYTVN